MTKDMNTPMMRNRTSLDFERLARNDFAFLNALGFSEVEVSPTLIRYVKGDIELDVYHGRQSYEISAGVCYFGTRYSLEEIIRATDPETAKLYRNFSATTPKGVAVGLEQLSSLMKRYAQAALLGDPQFLSALEAQRKIWSENYALDVLAQQLRPQADKAFQKGDYTTAAELYARIKARLSPAESKRLALAEERRPSRNPPS